MKPPPSRNGTIQGGSQVDMLRRFFRVFAGRATVRRKRVTPDA